MSVSMVKASDSSAPTARPADGLPEWNPVRRNRVRRAVRIVIASPVLACVVVVERADGSVERVGVRVATTHRPGLPREERSRVNRPFSDELASQVATYAQWGVFRSACMIR